jgi:hypothetical protein
MSDTQAGALRPFSLEERERRYRAIMEIAREASKLFPCDGKTSKELQDELYHPETGLPWPEGDLSLTDVKRAL